MRPRTTPRQSIKDLALKSEEQEEAHLSWKRRLDGYCACTAIVKERRGGRRGGQENEKRMGGGLAQRAGGHGEENFHSRF